MHGRLMEMGALSKNPFSNRLGKWLRSPLADAALLVVLVAIALSPLPPPGHWMARGPEPLRYFVLLDHFRGAVLHGAAYPRWLPELFGGLGYPEFVFYQSLFFFVALNGRF